MKRRLLLCSLLVLVLLSTNFSGAADHGGAANADGARLPAQHQMSFRFDVSASKETYLGQEWDVFQMGGSIEEGNAGQPRIPHKVVNLRLPSPLVKAEAKFADEVSYEGVMLEPRAPDYLPGLDILDPSRPLIDWKLYLRDGLLPADAYRVEKLGEGKSDSGQKLWAYNIVLNPLRYNPVSGLAILYQSCELSLYYDDAPSYFPLPRGPVEKYIIITSDAVNSSVALNPLVTWKTNKGLPAKVYTVEWINSTYSGWDTAEKIRNFLKDRCWNFGMEWLQLVGDDDTVPVRMVVNPHPIPPYDDNWIPTDTYYACLDSLSSWDAWNNNNIYGEVQDDNADGVYDHTDLDDIYPDVWVARFASNNTTRIGAWAQNSVNYEKSPAAGSWMHTALAVAPAAMPVSNAVGVKNKMEEYINKTMGSYGYLGELYGSSNITRLYEADGNLNQSRLVSAFNSGFAFGAWMANGTVDSFGSSTVSVGTLFNNTNANSLANGGRKPVIFGYSSSSGWFDGNECLGEALTENTGNGAIGFVGPARTSPISATLGYFYNPNATGMMMDFMYQMELGKKVNPYNLYMGRTLGNAKYAFWTANHSAAFEDALKGFYNLNLLGETNCPIWYDTPKDLNVGLAEIREGPDDKTVIVRVQNINTPLNQSLVCLYNTSAGYYAVNQTGLDGLTYFSMPRNMTVATMTVTRPGWAPYELTYTDLKDGMSPLTILNVTPPDPDGKNGWYKTTPRILLLTSEPNSTTYYNWDCSTVFLQYNASIAPLLAPDGEHQLYYYSTDYVGNSRPWASTLFSVDSSIPNSTAHVTPAIPDGDNGWYISLPVVNFTINGTIGYATLWYKIDAGSFHEYEANITIDEGLHDIYYYAETAAGNREPQRYISFKIDISLPSSIMVKTPTNPDGKNGWYRTIPSINLIPDEAGDMIIYHWDNDTEQNYTAGPLKAPEGVHNLFWQCRDEAGNREPVQNLTVMVDTKAPVTSIITSPAEPDGQNGWFIGQTTVTLDPGENGTAFYGWDQGLFFFCVTGPMELMEGTHTLYFYSNDTAGNHETNRQMIFKVDTGIPVTNMTVSPADKGLDWYIKKPRVKLETDTGAGVFYYWDTEVSSVQRYTKEFEVSEGEHTLHFYAKDDAGNKEIERIKLFKVDSITPQVALTISTPVANVNDTVIFNLSGTDANDVREYNIDFGDGNSTGWVTPLSLEHTYTTPGNYTIYARGRDPAGNEGRSSAVLLEIKAPYVPPIVNPTPRTEEKNNWLLPMVAIVALVAVVGIAAFAVSRRKSRGAPPPTAEEKAEMERKQALMPSWGGAEGAAGGAGAVSGGIVDRDLGKREDTAYPAAATTPSGARTMSCPKCGNEVEADADYCYTCGERWGKKGVKAVDTDLYKQTSAPAPPEPLQPTAPSEEQAPAYPQQPAPEEIAEAAAVPVEPPAAPRQEGDLDDILGRLESISAPATRTPPRQPPAPPAPPPPATAVPARPAPRAAPPPPTARPPAAPAPAHAAATAQGGTGKACPKCGTEMARLVELPGAQNEQLKRLNAKGQHAFQCRSCGHFEISKWP